MRGNTMHTRKLAGPEKISYRVSRLAHRRTLLFIHGLSGSSAAWKPYELHFATDYNVLSIDLRGHGFSFRPEQYEHYAISAFSDDIYRVLRQEGIHRCVLISNSFGTLIALDFLHRHRTFVEKAIFVGAEYAPAKRRAAQFLRPVIEMARIVQWFPTLRKRGGHVDYRKYVNTGDWNLRRSYADVRNTGVKSYLSALRQAYGFDGTTILSKIKVPVLFVHGRKDTIFPLRNAQEMMQQIPDAELVILPEADHIIVLNHVKRLINAIEAFL